MKRVAYLTGRTYRGDLIPEGETPAIEMLSRQLIQEAGRACGVSFEHAYWDDPNLAGRGFDAAVIRSCWDYTARATEFVETIERREREGLRIFNPSHIVRWNAQKTYLRELGPAAIETVWVDKVDEHAVAKAFDALDAVEIVVKPQVGAGSMNTVRLKRNAWSDADLRDAPRDAAMIQAYLRSIETEGERSLFWFGDALSHAVRKVPNAGSWYANLPDAARFFAEKPPALALAAAESARDHLKDGVLYARIDLVLGDDGKYRVIEIEAIEPYLFLDYAPEGARFFAEAVARVL